MDTFINDPNLSTKIADSSITNLNDRSIGDLINIDNIQIILFTDEDPSGSGSYANAKYFYDAQTYLFIPTGDNIDNTSLSTNNSLIFGSLDTVSDVRAFVLGNIRYGWPDDMLNVIYWTLDIGASFTEQHIYSSMQQFSSLINNDFHSVINKYHKLWFANIILVDFLEISDIMEHILLLNYQYANCRAALWGNNATSCPTLTALSSEFANDEVSQLCEINTNLQNDSWCPRSCGVCPSRFSTERNVGDDCSENEDCNGVLYQFYDTDDGEGECFQNPNTERSLDNIPQQSFCLSLNALSSCTNYEQSDKCYNGTTKDVDTSMCGGYCSANWQCVDGFCNTEYSICS